MFYVTVGHLCRCSDIICQVLFGYAQLLKLRIFECDNLKILSVLSAFTRTLFLYF